MASVTAAKMDLIKVVQCHTMNMFDRTAKTEIMLDGVHEDIMQVLMQTPMGYPIAPSTRRSNLI